MSAENELNAVELATELTIAWLGNQNNRVTPEDVPAFLRTMHATVTELAGKSVENEETAPSPAQNSHRPSRPASRWPRKITSSR